MNLMEPKLIKSNLNGCGLVSNKNIISIGLFESFPPENCGLVGKQVVSQILGLNYDCMEKL